MFDFEHLDVTLPDGDLVSFFDRDCLKPRRVYSV